MTSVALLVSSKVLAPVLSSLLLSLITYFILHCREFLKQKFNSPWIIKVASSICAGVALSNFISHSIWELWDLRVQLSIPKPEHPMSNSTSYPDISSSPSLYTIDTYSPMATGAVIAATTFIFFKALHCTAHASQCGIIFFFSLDALLESGALLSIGQDESNSSTVNYHRLIAGFEALLLHKIIETLTMTGNISKAGICPRVIFSLLPFLWVIIGLVLTNHFDWSKNVKYWTNIALTGSAVGFFGFLAYDLVLDALDSECSHGNIPAISSSHSHSHNHELSLSRIFSSCFWKKNICNVALIVLSTVVGCRLSQAIEDISPHNHQTCMSNHKH